MVKFGSGWRPLLRPVTGKGLLTLVAAAVLAGCGARGADQERVPDDDDLPPGYVRIDSGGGAIPLPDNRGAVRFPAGAVSGPVAILIKPVDPITRPEYAGAALAFEVQPANIVLNKPAEVEVLLDGKPREFDGSLRAGVGAIVLTRKGNGSAEAIVEQSVTVDAGTNTTWAKGLLPRLDSFAFSSRLKTDAGTPAGSMTVSLQPLPDDLTVQTNYRVQFDAATQGFDSTTTVSARYAYKDASGNPLRHTADAGNPPDTDGYYRLNPPTLAGVSRITLGGAGYSADAAADRVDSDIELKLDDSNLRVDFGGQLLALPKLRYSFHSTHTAEQAAPPPPPTPPTEGAYRLTYVRRGAENLVALDRWTDFRQRAELPAGSYVALATSNPGVHIVDLSTGDNVRSQEIGGPMFGIVPHLKDGLACVFGYGAFTARTCHAPEAGNFGFTEIGIGTGPVTDADLLSMTPIATPTGPRHLLWYVGNGRVVQEIPASGGSAGVQQRGLDPRGGVLGWYRNGGAASGTPQSAYFNANGDRVLVVRGEAAAPGQLWWGNPGDPAGGVFVGSLGADGNDTRKIRCVLPVCAVSSFGGLVTIVLWDGVNVPAIVGTIAGTTGAVGIDVAPEGANRAIRSADFNAGTVTKTIVDVSGQVVSSVTKPVPPGCSKPGHVTSQSGENGQAQTFVSCNLSDVQDKSAIAMLNDPLYFGQ